MWATMEYFCLLKPHPSHKHWRATAHQIPTQFVRGMLRPAYQNKALDPLAKRSVKKNQVASPIFVFEPVLIAPPYKYNRFSIDANPIAYKGGEGAPWIEFSSCVQMNEWGSNWNRSSKIWSAGTKLTIQKVRNSNINYFPNRTQPDSCTYWLRNSPSIRLMPP